MKRPASKAPRKKVLMTDADIATLALGRWVVRMVNKWRKEDDRIFYWVSEKSAKGGRRD